MGTSRLCSREKILYESYRNHGLGPWQQWWSTIWQGTLLPYKSQFCSTSFIIIIIIDTVTAEATKHQACSNCILLHSFAMYYQLTLTSFSVRDFTRWRTWNIIPPRCIVRKTLGQWAIDGGVVFLKQLFKWIIMSRMAREVGQEVKS